MFEFVRCSINDVRVCSMFDKMVLDPSLQRKQELISRFFFFKKCVGVNFLNFYTVPYLISDILDKIIKESNLSGYDGSNFSDLPDFQFDFDTLDHDCAGDIFEAHCGHQNQVLPIGQIATRDGPKSTKDLPQIQKFRRVQLKKYEKTSQNLQFYKPENAKNGKKSSVFDYFTKKFLVAFGLISLASYMVYNCL